MDQEYAAPEIVAPHVTVVLQLHLLILDPKTHIVLWAFTEDVEGESWKGRHARTSIKRWLLLWTT
jgi:outer membrane protein assembly factor BamB